MGDRDDRIEAQGVEPMVEDGVPDLGRDALTPGGPDVTIAELDQP